MLIQARREGILHQIKKRHRSWNMHVLEGLRALLHNSTAEEQQEIRSPKGRNIQIGKDLEKSDS